MSAATKNLFALLDSDDDEPVQKKAPVKATTTKNVPAAGKPVATKNTGKKPFNKPVIAEPSKNEGVSRGSQSGDRRRGARPNRGPRTEGEGGDRRPRREGGNGERRAPRREFERRSGTGRDKTVKKEGGGARNWGSNEAEAETATPEAEATDATAATEEEETAEEAAPVAPEPVTFTLDEFRARQAAERSQGEGFGELEIREVDASEFSEFSVKAKEEEESFFAGGANKQKREKARKTKAVLTGKDVGFRAPAVERGDGRGDRGDRRGRGERGEGRGGRGGRGNRAPNVTNANDFPTLA